MNVFDMDEFEEKIKRVVGAVRYQKMRKQGLTSEAKLEEAFLVLYFKHYAETGRAQARRRYNASIKSCEKCGETPNKMQIHHIIPLSQGGSNEESNIGFLCAKCHHEFHKKYGYNCDMDDFNEFCGG